MCVCVCVCVCVCSIVNGCMDENETVRDELLKGKYQILFFTPESLILNCL